MALREDLDLDLAGALRSIDRLETALTTVASRFRSELAAALDVLQTETVEIEADTAGVSEEITGSIDEGVRAADTEAQIDVDTGPAETALEDLEETAEDTGDEMESMGSRGAAAVGIIAAALASAAIADKLRDATELAAGFNETLNRTDVVFGELAPQINALGEGSAEAFGLASDQAVSAAADFGDLLTALGTTTERAAEMSTEVVQLAADLASFKDVDPTEVLDRIRSGVIGEIEPLRRMGIAFNAAQVEAKALELGLADATGEISENAKVQARFALIIEQTSAAQGDFARTSESVTNQQRILAAEIRNASLAIGAQLLPFAGELISEFRDLVPILTELASAALPLLVEGFTAVEPLLGTTTRILEVLAPIIGAFADAIEIIPDPLLQIAAAAATLNLALGPLGRGLGSLSRIAVGAGGGIGGLGAAMRAINPIALGLGAGLVGVTTVMGQAREEARLLAAQAEQLGDILEESAGDVDVLTRSLAQFITEASVFELRNQIDDLNRLGVSARELTALLEDGEEGLRTFIERALALGEIEIRPEALQRFAQEGRNAVDALVEAGPAIRDLISGNDELIFSFVQTQEQLQGQAEALIDAGIASGRFSEALVESSIEATRAADGSENFVGALGRLERIANFTAASVDNATAAAQSFADIADEIDAAFGTAFDLPLAQLDFSTALEGLASSGPRAASGVSRATSAVADFEAEVVSAEDRLSRFEETLDRILGQEFGLEAAQDAFTERLREFLRAARGAEDFESTLSGISEAAVDNREAFRGLVEGAADVISAAREQGVTGEELQEIIDEQEAAVIALAEALGFTEEETARYVDVLERIGPETEDANRALDDEVAALNAQALAEARARDATAAATRATRDQATASRDAVRDLSVLAGSIDTVAREMIEAGEPIENVTAAVRDMQQQVIAGAGIAGITDTQLQPFLDFMERLIAVLPELARAAGEQTIEGLIEGIRSGENELFTAVEEVGDELRFRFRSGLQIQSPSRFMIEAGRELIAGLIAGLDESEPDAVAAIESFGDSLIASFDRIVDQLGVVGDFGETLATRIRNEISGLLGGAALGEVFSFDDLFADLEAFGFRAGTGFAAEDLTLEEEGRRRTAQLAREAREARQAALDEINALETDVAALELSGVLDDAGRRAGLNMIAGLTDALGEGSDDLVRAIAELGRDIIAEFEETLAISSPSALTRRIGTDLVAGLAEGLREETDVVAAAQSLSGALTSRLTPAFATPAAATGQVTASLDTGALDRLTAAVSAAQQPLVGSLALGDAGSARANAAEIMRALRAKAFQQGRV